MSNTVEQTLIQIERNLEKLESARTQVLDVTQSGKQISAIMVDLVRKIKEVYGIVSHESDSFIDGVALNQQKLEEHTRQIMMTSNDSIAAFLTQLNTFKSKLSNSIDQSAKEASLSTKRLLESQDKVFSDHVEQLTGFGTILKQFKTDIQEVSFVDQLRPLEDSINSNGEKIISAIRPISANLLNVVEGFYKNLQTLIEDENAVLTQKLVQENSTLLPTVELQLDNNKKAVLTALLKLQSDLLTAIESGSRVVQDSLTGQLEHFQEKVHQDSLNIAQDMREQCKEDYEKISQELLSKVGMLEAKHKKIFYITWLLTVFVLIAIFLLAVLVLKRT
jgi:hypothetical protein